MKNKTGINHDSMKKGIYILPNLFTTASLFCGFYSLIASMGGNFFQAAVSIMVAAVLDGLDGRIARFTNTTSRFGVEYDSLSDLVAFGVAPAVLAYTWALSSFGRYGWLAAFLFAACGAMRLARFNVRINVVESSMFDGLPIPAAAGVVASGVLLSNYFLGEGRFEHVSVIFGMVVLALLMVSNVKYYSFKDLNYFSRKPFMTFVLIILVLGVVILEPQVMLFTFALSYSLSGPLWALFRIMSNRNKEVAEVKHRNGI